MRSSDSPAISRLSTAECWTILEAEQLGRLALVDGDGLPDIFPVNFVAHEGAVYVRTAHDIKLLRITTHPFAAFEVDGEDGTTHWSVVVRGPVTRVRSGVEIERSGAAQLVTWSPRQKPFVIKVTASTVTGRRFARVTEHTPPITMPPPALDGLSPDQPGDHRAIPPDPIPSLRPMED